MFCGFRYLAKVLYNEIMGFNFFQRKKAAADCFLSLDIGTEFVKAAVFVISGRKTPTEKSAENKRSGKQGKIIGFSRCRQAPNQMQGGAVMDIDGVALTCHQAINEAVRMAKIRPQKVIMGIAGEFVKGATTNFVYQRTNHKSQIDLSELKNIIQKIQWKSFDKLRGQFACETGQPEIEIKLINALIADIRIDGYKVTNPIGFQGKEVFLSIFNVYAPAIHLKALETIAAKLDLTLAAIAAEPYALSRSIYSDYFNAEAELDNLAVNSAIFIDIGGGTTDVALVRYNRVEGIKSLALAGRSFTKRLSKSLGVSMTEAEDIKLKHTDQQLSANVHQKIRGILEKDTQIWFSGLRLVLEEFSQKDFFPPLILLCGGGSLLPDIKNALIKNQKQLLEHFPFSQPPKIDFIQPCHIANVIDQTGFLNGPENVAPMALVGLALEIFNDGDKKSLLPTLRQAVKIIRR